MEIKDKKIVYDGYFKMEEITVLTPDNKITTREKLFKRNAVASLVYDTIKKKFIFTKQWRNGLEDFIVEIAAGTIDNIDDDPKETMIREIDEELGYKVDKITKISKLYSSPGITNETVTLYYSEVSEKISEGGGTDEHEFIEIIEMTIDEMIDSEFMDMKTNLMVGKWI